MKKIIILYLLYILAGIDLVYGQFFIQESDIPLPEIIHELPQSLIGEFVMITPRYDQNITIFSNNKYIVTREVYSHHYLDWSWGHVVNIDNKWFFSPLSYTLRSRYRDNLNNRLLEINLTDTGFSYSDEPSIQSRAMQSIRIEDLPVPTNPAPDITISIRLARNQYITFDNLQRIDFNEIDLLPERINVSHSMRINNGNIEIMCLILYRDLLYRDLLKATDPRKTPGEPLMAELYHGYEDEILVIKTIFDGFIELSEENENGFKGIIRFTNGVPYYYIEDGTAQIEKINDDIFITILYDRHSISGINILPDGFQFPAKLVLEF